MRKVTLATVSAFLANEKGSVGNTVSSGDALFLHGNKIAEWRDGAVWVTFAGWPTVTTKDRLNGICRLYGIPGGFYSYQKCLLFQGRPVESNEWIKLEKVENA